MAELFEQKIHALRKRYQTIMFGLLTLSAGVLLLHFLFPGLPNFTQKAALISKSVLIILFLSIIPLMLSHFKRKLYEIPRDREPLLKITAYQRQFYIKTAVIVALCLLTLLVFALSGDPMILVLLLAGVLFLFFERPSRLKIYTDLDIDD